MARIGFLAGVAQLVERQLPKLEPDATKGVISGTFGGCAESAPSSDPLSGDLAGVAKLLDAATPETKALLIRMLGTMLQHFHAKISPDDQLTRENREKVPGTSDSASK